ncbi:MAG: ribonuclease H-like domain-containing protein [Halanaerobiales bacterium]
MNIRDKLRQLDRNPKSLSRKTQNESKQKLSSYFENGSTAEDNNYFFRTTKYKPDHKHGLYPLNKIFELKTEDISLITNAQNDFNSLSPHDLLFFDTETTGLMGGTGTIPFLIGLGYFEGESFIVKQLFMRDFDEEMPVLSTLATEITKYQILISFNGKSFDLPLLKTRMIMNRLSELNIPYHLDLLSAARSLWSHLDSCSLNNLEKRVLNINRNDDLPGSKVPQMYFKYLDQKKPEYIEPIFEHNTIDIVSMVTMLIHLQKIHKNSRDFHLSARELYNLGCLYEKRKDLIRSINFFEKALQLNPDLILSGKIKTKLSWQYKRNNQWDKAVRIWNSMIRKNQGGIFPWRELAKYQEHQQKNFKQARKHTRKALSLLQKKRILYDDFTEQKQKLTHRLQRLENKINN